MYRTDLGEDDLSIFVRNLRIYSTMTVSCPTIVLTKYFSVSNFIYRTTMIVTREYRSHISAEMNSLKRNLILYTNYSKRTYRVARPGDVIN